MFIICFQFRSLSEVAFSVNLGRERKLYVEMQPAYKKGVWKLDLKVTIRKTTEIYENLPSF